MSRPQAKWSLVAAVWPEWPQGQAIWGQCRLANFPRSPPLTPQRRCSHCFCRFQIACQPMGRWAPRLSHRAIELLRRCLFFYGCVFGGKPLCLSPFLLANELLPDSHSGPMAPSPPFLLSLLHRCHRRLGIAGASLSASMPDLVQRRKTGRRRRQRPPSGVCFPMCWSDS